MTIPRPSSQAPLVAATVLGLVAALFLLMIPERTINRLPLQHFINPSVNTSQALEKNESAEWLIATMSPVTGPLRRQIIRQTWQELYQGPKIDFRFVIANYSDLWEPLIRSENDTYGDLICLCHLKENVKIANSVKSVEFLKHMIKTTPSGSRRYKYVSKADDDVYLALKNFYTEYMAPRLRNNSEGTLIGRPLNLYRKFELNSGPYVPLPYYYPSGRFYTLSWDMVATIADLHTRDPITDEHEDVLIGRLLYEANITVPSFVKLDKERTFDLGWEGRVDNRTLLVHQIKEDQKYLDVASVFGPDGYNGRYVRGVTSIDRKPPRDGAAEGWESQVAGYEEDQEQRQGEGEGTGKEEGKWRGDRGGAE